MWLYTINVWSATVESRLAGQFTNVTDRVESRFYQGQNINDGLGLLRDYAVAFNRKHCPGDHGTSIDYRLLSVQKLPDDTNPSLLNAAGALEISSRELEDLIDA